MAEARVPMALALIVLLIGSADVAAQSTDCTTQITTLATCLNYVGGNDKNPSTSCCNALAKVVSTNATCLCQVLSGISGFQFNQTKALSLPASCNVNIPPHSSCNKAASPTAAVVSSTPVSNPGNSPPPATGANTNAGPVSVPSIASIVSVAALVSMRTLR